MVARVRQADLHRVFAHRDHLSVQRGGCRSVDPHPKMGSPPI
jgi:hypothetical protein